ncbi:MAG TPA: hypothetical protein VFH61_00625 [Thermoleophilia bacterium]|nr:hypothetical protein [Thermoleophilia bacterium]
MRKSLQIWSTLVLALTLATPSWAQVATSTPAVPASFHAKATVIDGEEHVAWPNGEAAYLIWLHQKRRPQLKAALDGANALIRVQHARIKTTDESLELAVKTSSKAVSVLNKMEAAADELKAANETGFWTYVPPFILGVAAGIIVWELKK